MSATVTIASTSLRRFFRDRSNYFFVLILPMKQKQRKVEEMTKTLKSGDKVVLSSGIFGTIVAVEDDAFALRIDQSTKIRVLKSAVAGRAEAPDMEKKQ